MNPKSRRLFILVIAALISAIVFTQSHSHLESLYTSQPSLSSLGWKAQTKFAYATFLGGSTSKDDSQTDPEHLKDPYFISVRLLNYQIKHAEKTRTRLSNAPFLVLVLPSVPRSQLDVLKQEGATIVRVEALDLPDAFDKDFIKSSRFRDVLSKLRLWQLTAYDKILYLDADSYLLENLDGIFTDPILSTPQKTLPPNRTDNKKLGQSVQPPDTYLMAASADTYGDQTEWEQPGHINYLCACFMLITPSQELFNYYMNILTGPEAPQRAVYPEQDLLIYVHREEGQMPWRRISIKWSANDGDMVDELREQGGVKSLHVKGWEGGEGGNVAGEKWKAKWRELVGEMEGFYKGRGSLGKNFRDDGRIPVY
ncbi:nucleotide-diphospho-sugar transferase [Lojkania enalia]|uniref:Nucleotide-diphospho-sugar transferase n=1 Tax=Lojkania enalia TaxID=147567 RepID=A0A9P4K5W7_9PLEO|nr:nucleotide-diphospho-sugar transferase [Didymosphaeria enalia]